MHCEKEEQVMQPATAETERRGSFGQWVTSKMYEGIMRGTECAARAGMSPQAWSDYTCNRTQRKSGRPRRLHPETLQKIALGLEMGYGEVEGAYRKYARFPAMKTEDTPAIEPPRRMQGELDLHDMLSDSMQKALKELGDRRRNECR